MIPVYETTHQAYNATLRALLGGRDACSRGLSHLELEDYGFTVLDPTTDPIRTCDEQLNAKIWNYTRKEFELYDSGTNSAEEFARHAKLWNGIRNPDGTVNSAYGHLIWKNLSCGSDKFGDGPMTPWHWARSKLLEDIGTRQAILRFSLPEHQWHGNKDQVCTMHGYFRIREDRLNLTIVMRSNDVRRGLPYDMPWFCSLLYHMLHDLIRTYPELKIGTYTHIAHSMHLYTRDIADARLMIGDTKR